MAAVPGEKEFYDIAAPQEFLDAHGKFDATKLASWKRFKGDQSKDFYLGMIAAFRISSSVVNSWIKNNPDDIIDYLTDCSIVATAIARPILSNS